MKKRRKPCRLDPRTDPHAIGFFARMNDLTLEDVLEHPIFGHLVASKRSQELFLDGYEAAEWQLVAERFEDLEENLCENAQMVEEMRRKRDDQ